MKKQQLVQDMCLPVVTVVWSQERRKAPKSSQKLGAIFQGHWLGVSTSFMAGNWGCWMLVKAFPLYILLWCVHPLGLTRELICSLCPVRSVLCLRMHFDFRKKSFLWKGNLSACSEALCPESVTWALFRDFLHNVSSSLKMRAATIGPGRSICLVCLFEKAARRFSNVKQTANVYYQFQVSGRLNRSPLKVSAVFRPANLSNIWWPC